MADRAHSTTAGAKATPAGRAAALLAGLVGISGGPAACLIPNPSHSATDAGKLDGGDAGTTSGAASGTVAPPATGPADAGEEGDDEGGLPETGAEGGATSSAPVGTDGGLDTGGRIPVGCDPGSQDCAKGFKCNPFSASGDGQYDDSACFEVFGDLGIGQPCQFIDFPLSGLDDCGVGLTCLMTADLQELGVCAHLCDLAGAQACEGEFQACISHGSGVFAFCRATCEPLIQDCPVNEGCYVLDEGPVCLPTQGDGSIGDPCDVPNGCSAGFACVPGELLEGGCAFGACCTPYCDLMVGGPCMVGEACVPISRESPEVGVCTDTD